MSPNARIAGSGFASARRRSSAARTSRDGRANGAALGLLTAWTVEWRLTRNDEDTDRIGLWVFAAVLFGLSAAWPAANIVAAVGGAAAGALGGYALAQRNR